MTDISIQKLVKCPMIFEYEPCDLIPVSDCKKCGYRVRIYKDTVICKWGE